MHTLTIGSIVWDNRKGIACNIKDIDTKNGYIVLTYADGKTRNKKVFARDFVNYSVLFSAIPMDAFKIPQHYDDES